MAGLGFADAVVSYGVPWAPSACPRSVRGPCRSVPRQDARSRPRWQLFCIREYRRRTATLSLEPLKPIDVVVALRLAEAPDAKYEQLSADLGISSSSAHAAVRRLQAAGLLRPNSRTVNRLALREFLEHGLRYAFPAQPGAQTRGVPTAHSGPPLAARVVAEDTLVWPSASGAFAGQELERRLAPAA